MYLDHDCRSIVDVHRSCAHLATVFFLVLGVVHTQENVHVWQLSSLFDIHIFWE